MERLDEECQRALQAFVDNGGGLVVTGRTSLAVADGQPSENFGLADLLGVDYKGMTPHYYTYLCADRTHAALDGLSIGFPLCIYETQQTLVRPRPGTAALGVVMEPLPGFHMGYPPYRRTEYSALTVREVGKGRVVYFSSPQGAYR